MLYAVCFLLALRPNNRIIIFRTFVFNLKIVAALSFQTLIRC